MHQPAGWKLACPANPPLFHPQASSRTCFRIPGLQAVTPPDREAGNIVIPDNESTTCSAMPTDLPPTSPRADEADLEVAHNAVAERPSMTYSCLFKIILIDYP